MTVDPPGRARLILRDLSSRGTDGACPDCGAPSDWTSGGGTSISNLHLTQVHATYCELDGAARAIKAVLPELPPPDLPDEIRDEEW